MRVTERRDGYARFETISDGSKLPSGSAGTALKWRGEVSTRITPG